MTVDFTFNDTYMAALLAPLDDLAEAACVRADPRLFDSDRRTTAKVQAARMWCEDCPVAQKCLNGAITRSDSGVWGGRMLVDGRDVTPVSLEGVDH